MKIIFFGTPSYVVNLVDQLNKNYEVCAVVTQSPKPQGREKKLTYSAVDTWAHKRKIPIFFDFDELPQADLGVCASFGKIIPGNVINHFKYGILNVHPSLLPKYRGPSPIQTAIANLEQETGVTIIKMDEKMDHGQIVTTFKEQILPEDTFESLRNKLFDRSKDVLLELIPSYIKNKINLITQDEQKATFTNMITKNDGFVDLKKDDPKIIEAKYRAYTPWPGIWTKIKLKNETVEKRLKIIKCHLDNDAKLVIDEVQLEGKNKVPFYQFISSYSLAS